MKLTEERKTYIIGVLLTLVFLCQISGSIAGGKQQYAYQRIHWLVSHNTKALALLSNFANLFILDKNHTEENFENYRNGLSETAKQHQQMKVEEAQLLKDIDFWSKVGLVSNIFGLFFTGVVMISYLYLIRDLSQRINKS